MTSFTDTEKWIIYVAGWVGSALVAFVLCALAYRRIVKKWAGETKSSSSSTAPTTAQAKAQAPLVRMPEKPRHGSTSKARAPTVTNATYVEPMVEPPMMDPDFLEGFDTREQEKIWRELATQDAAAGRAAKPAPAAEKKPDNIYIEAVATGSYFVPAPKKQGTVVQPEANREYMQAAMPTDAGLEWDEEQSFAPPGVPAYSRKQNAGKGKVKYGFQEDSSSSDDSSDDDDMEWNAGAARGKPAARAKPAAAAPRSMPAPVVAPPPPAPAPVAAPPPPPPQSAPAPAPPPPAVTAAPPPRNTVCSFLGNCTCPNCS